MLPDLRALEDAQAGLRKACRQVYEIKAQHTINNLAAYHKKIPHCIIARLYDVYIHFKCTSLSSACIYLMQRHVTKGEGTTGKGDGVLSSGADRA